MRIEGIATLRFPLTQLSIASKVLPLTSIENERGTTETAPIQWEKSCSKRWQDFFCKDCNKNLAFSHLVSSHLVLSHLVLSHLLLRHLATAAAARNNRHFYGFSEGFYAFIKLNR